MSVVPSSERPAVLVVDDDPEQLRMLEIFLRGSFDVATATSANEAIHRLGRERLPAVIVTDLQMPGTHGVSFIRYLRAQPELSTIPVLALSGHSKAKDVVASIQAGAKAYLEKPVSSERLLETVKRLGREH